jgi:hypothetical protein
MKTPKAKAATDLIEHWYTLVPKHQFSSKEVYATIRKEIEAQKIPKLGISEIDLSEGGMLSHKRTYQHPGCRCWGNRQNGTALASDIGSHILRLRLFDHTDIF